MDASESTSAGGAGRGSQAAVPAFARVGALQHQATLPSGWGPVVCAHSLRGMHATFATEAGMTGDAIAAQLGHSSPVVTRAHYTLPEAIDSARQAAVLKKLRKNSEQESGADLGSISAGSSHAYDSDENHDRA